MLIEAYALGRVALGATAILLPAPVCQIMGLGDAPALGVAGRMLGGRDLCLGLGLYLAQQRGEPLHTWIEASVLVDAVDGLATLDGVRKGTLSRGHGAMVGALVLGSIGAGLWLRARTAR